MRKGGGQVPSAKRLADGSHGIAHARHCAHLGRQVGGSCKGRRGRADSARTLKGAIMSAMSG
jgi:hypothetical protein